MGKLFELRACDKEGYQEFIGCTTKHISELEERLESKDHWVNDILKLYYKKDQMIESLQQEMLTKENVMLVLKSEVKKVNQEKIMYD